MATNKEEDDYMNMTFAETEASTPATSLQRKQLHRKEAEQRARPKSKKELEAEAVTARNLALATTLDPSNKGAKLMARLGYKGGALGKSENARTQPIEVLMKEDRGGIGADSEKKRKLREHMDSVQGKEKRQKADEGEFRERNRREREDKRNEGMMWGAMRIAEKFDTEAQEEYQGRSQNQALSPADTTEIESEQTGQESQDNQAQRRDKPNVLWRTLVNQRADRDRERKMRQGVTNSLSVLGRQVDPEEDGDDKIALGTEVEDLEDEEDQELEEFTAQEPVERLNRIVQYLRSTYNYCFWCKFRYPDAEMEGCPGTTEEDHD